jgi:hypothetical protein
MQGRRNRPVEFAECPEPSSDANDGGEGIAAQAAARDGRVRAGDSVAGRAPGDTIPRAMGTGWDGEPSAGIEPVADSAFPNGTDCFSYGTSFVC